MWIINLIGWLADRFFPPPPPPPPGPALSPDTQRRLRILFAEPDWVAAEALLFDQCGNNLPARDKLNAVELERFRFAALKLSGGSLDKLGGAVVLANIDWRDLLMSAGFGEDLSAHQQWEPK